MPFFSLLPPKLTRILWALFGLCVLYAIFSYSLTDPNLILTSWPPYWNFQQGMWQQFFHNHPLLTGSYLVLVMGFLGVYAAGWRYWSRRSTPSLSAGAQKTFWLACLLALSPLFLSYNALSHDVFNYLFNAKMVVVYNADPHVQTALEYARDDWTRFMHNTHTPAPYGYGWTALSLLPYMAGFGRLLPTWLLFRGLAVVSVVLLTVVLNKLAYKTAKKSLSPSLFWLVVMNPLVFLEVVSNQHNDLWMMVPALTALVVIYEKPKHWPTVKILVSALLLAGSISLKLATVVLIPLWLLWLGRWFLPTLRRWLSWPRVALMASLLLFVPLLTERSQQFLPWYLTWSLIWLPFIKERWWRAWLVALSITGLLRYVPWLWAGGFSPEVLMQQKLILWGGAALIWLGWWLTTRMRYNRS